MRRRDFGSKRVLFWLIKNHRLNDRKILTSKVLSQSTNSVLRGALFDGEGREDLFPKGEKRYRKLAERLLGKQASRSCRLCGVERAPFVNEPNDYY